MILPVRLTLPDCEKHEDCRIVFCLVEFIANRAWLYPAVSFEDGQGTLNCIDVIRVCCSLKRCDLGHCELPSDLISLACSQADPYYSFDTGLKLLAFHELFPGGALWSA